MAHAFLLRLSLLGVLGVLALPTGPAVACACCTAIGQRFDGMVATDAAARAQLGQLQPRPTARLFADESWPDAILGIRNPVSGDYALTLTQAAKQIVFDVREAETGRTGRITFALPGRHRAYAADPRLRDREGGTGPSLVKEWVFSGPAGLSGLFAAAGSRAGARLIVHAAGNACVALGEAHAWTLEIRGKGVSFTLLGRFVRAGVDEDGDGGDEEGAAPLPR